MKTFFMIKPDGVQRNLVGEIISRVEAKGFSITKIKMMTISKELAEHTHRMQIWCKLLDYSISTWLT